MRKMRFAILHPLDSPRIPWASLPCIPSVHGGTGPEPKALGNHGGKELCMERKELMTADEAAAYLNITKRTVLKWARAGRIERVKISAKVVRFTAEAIDNFLKNQTVEIQSKTTQRKPSRQRTSDGKSEKGGEKRSSGESWRSLRKEVATWR